MTVAMSGKNYNRGTAKH